MSSSLYFRELSIRNFLSFGQNTTTIDLTVPGTISVEGVNYDQGGSNGSGKCIVGSTLLNIRKKGTTEVLTISIGELYAMAKRSKDNCREGNR